MSTWRFTNESDAIRLERFQIDELKRVAPAMLEEWSRTKRAPRHAAWLHELEFRGDEAGSE